MAKNKLTLINYYFEKEKGDKGAYKGLYKCDCGNIKSIRNSYVNKGITLSCGCLRGEIQRNESLEYGGLTKNNKLYTVWKAMKQRCYNKNNKKYEYYGGKGVIITFDWLNDFKCFYNWSINNGYKEGLTIDRIDVNGNYEPNNCRWSTYSEQNYNTTKSIGQEKADLIRKEYEKGKSAREVGRIFNVVHTTVIKIVNNEVYKNT